MGPVRYTLHAIQEIARRKLDVQLIERTVRTPDAVTPADFGRFAYVKRYDDAVSGNAFVIRVIVEKTGSSFTVVTAYRSSRVRRYLKDPSS